MESGTKGLSPNNRVRRNRIEHRLFAFITQNWRGKPLLTHQVIVQSIASTTTRTGLTVQCRLDRSAYAKGVRVSDAEMATLNLQPAAFQVRERTWPTMLTRSYFRQGSRTKPHGRVPKLPPSRPTRAAKDQRHRSGLVQRG